MRARPLGERLASAGSPGRVRAARLREQHGLRVDAQRGLLAQAPSAGSVGDQGRARSNAHPPAGATSRERGYAASRIDNAAAGVSAAGEIVGSA